MRWRSNRWPWGAATALLVGAALAAMGWWTMQHWGVELARADYPAPSPGPVVFFDASSYSVTEGGTVTVTVLLSSPADEAVSVDYQVSHPAVGVVESGTITFAAGSTSYAREISFTDDNYCTGTITLTLQLTNAVGGEASLGSPSEASLDILDDDVCDCGACPTCDTACGS